MKNRARVCHLSSVHSAFSGRIFQKECKTLTKAGFKVTFLAQYDRDKGVDGIQLRALPKPRNRFERMTYLLYKVYQAAINEKAQIYHFHDPELILVGILLKLHGKHVIYDVHEDYPNSLLNKGWLHPWFRAVVAKGVALAERASVNFFDGIVAATPEIAKRFSASKTVVVQNFPIQHEWVQDIAIDYRHRPPIITYVGGISVLRGVKEMILAVGQLPENLGARLYLAGKFSPAKLEDEIKILPGWERVDFMGYLSRDSIVALFEKSRIGLAVLHSIKTFRESYPIKLFEYMSAGMPVVVSDFPLWREIVGGAGCGLLVDPLDPKAILEAMRWLLEHPEEAEAMGQRGQEAVFERYNWNREGEKLLKFYKDILQ